jgi:hypothetical protein
VYKCANSILAVVPESLYLRVHEGHIGFKLYDMVDHQLVKFKRSGVSVSNARLLDESLLAAKFVLDEVG